MVIEQSLDSELTLYSAITMSLTSGTAARLLRQPSRTRFTNYQMRGSLYNSARLQGSPLFQLGALSNSRESKWLSKASGIPPTEYSPQLQLIRSGEVEPFRKQARPHNDPRTTKDHARSARDSRSAQELVREARAISVGRAIMDQQRKEKDRLQRLLRCVRRAHERERSGWQVERRKLLADSKHASIIVVGAIAAATAMAIWRVSPRSQSVEDSASPVKNEAPLESLNASRRLNAAEGLLDGMALLHYCNYEQIDSDLSVPSDSTSGHKGESKPKSGSRGYWFWSSAS